MISSYVVAASLLQEKAIWPSPPSGGPLRARLEENIPTREITVPVLINQGEADTAVASAAQDAYVRDCCSRGRGIDYRRYQGLDHMPMVGPGSPAIADALARTTAVLDGRAVEGIC